MTLPAAISMRYMTLHDAVCAAELEPRAWLGPEELGELEQFADSLRRRQWLAGRWVAKQLIRETHEADLSQVQVLTRSEAGRGTRPLVLVGERPLDAWLSIAHSERGVVAALSVEPQWSVGIDLAHDIPCDWRFQQLWFTADERRWVNDDARRAATIWSIKEAVFKACHTGQPWSPRLVTVAPRDNAIAPRGDSAFVCTLAGVRIEELSLTVQVIDEQVAGVACVPRVRGAAAPLDFPIFMSEPSWSVT